MESRRRGDATGRQCFAAAVERLPSLCLGSVDSTLGKTEAQGDVIVVRWADDFVIGFQHKIGSGAVSGGTEEAIRKFGWTLHPGEDAASGIRSLCDRQPAAARTRESGDIRLPGLHAYLREEEKQRNVYGDSQDGSSKTA